MLEPGNTLKLKVAGAVQVKGPVVIVITEASNRSKGAMVRVTVV